jgi:hypothetical protein
MQQNVSLVDMPVFVYMSDAYRRNDEAWRGEFCRLSGEPGGVGRVKWTVGVTRFGALSGASFCATAAA